MSLQALIEKMTKRALVTHDIDMLNICKAAEVMREGLEECSIGGHPLKAKDVLREADQICKAGDE